MTFRLAVVAGALLTFAACDRERGELSRAEQALQELQRMVEETTEQAPEDPVQWAREDLERYGDWEYRIVAFEDTEPDALEEELNTLGQERWEVFWVERSGQGLNLFLKRPAISYLRRMPFSQIGQAIPGSEQSQ